MLETKIFFARLGLTRGLLVYIERGELEIWANHVTWREAKPVGKVAFTTKISSNK